MLNRVLDRFRAVAQFVSTERVRVYFLLLVVIVAGFTAGFHELYPFLEGEPISWISSLLFVVETLTTTGYGDLLPFSNQLTSLLATVIMGTGVVLFFIGVPVLLTPIIAQVIRTTPPRRPGRVFEGHTVIIGYDDTVRSILESLRVGDVPAIVVVEDETTALQAHGRHRGEAHVIWGDPGVALTQRAASLGAARHVVVVGSEQEVATTVLAVRDRTSAVVIAIVDDPSFERYIRFAGADYVLSPKDIVGRILARYGFVAADVESVAGAAPGTWILDRSLDHGDGLVLVTAPVPRGAPAVGRTLDEIGFQDRHGVAPVILWRGGRFTILPPGDTVVDAASMLFLLGRPGEVADAIEHELAVPATNDRRAIIAGYGDVGAAACRELASRGVEITVIDPRDHEVPTVIGRAEDEAVLKRSGVEDAGLLVVAVNDDAVNIFTTLMARNLNPDLKIVARANHPRAVDRLYRAGADFVTLQPTIGGQVVAGIILSDRVRILLDLPGGHRVVQHRWTQAGERTVGWIERQTGALVVGVEGAAGAVVRPGPDVPVREGDRLTLIGGVNELRHAVEVV